MTRALVIGYGNPGRLDDGLGPALALAVGDLPGVRTEHAYQLNIEHAAAVADADTVVFADATVAGPEPCFFRPLRPRRAESFTSHAARPEAILALAGEAFGWTGRAFLMGVRGYSFNEYAERLSDGAARNLGAAADLLREALLADDPEIHTTGGPIDDSGAACNGGAPCETAET
jgi:hydrogenase maturation protease